MGLNLIYLATLALAFPFLLYRALRYKKYREGWGEKALGLVPKLEAPREGVKRVWFHAVSVGEVNLLKPIVAALDASGRDWEFVVSSTSKTGYALAKRLFGDRVPVFYCPLDFTWSVRRALRRIQPDALALAELELWPNLIKEAKRRGTKVAIVNGRISDRSFPTYKRVKKWLAPTFGRIDAIVAQDETAAGYFRELSPRPENVFVSGSIKFDGVLTDRANPKTERLARIVGFGPDDVVFLCGSSQSPEEEGALEVFRRLKDEFPRLKLALAPRHPERFEEVARLVEASGEPWTRRSRLADEPVAEPRRVVLIDAMGELGAWWGTASIGFVGGSWGARGGQNMLEPSGFGVAVSFGPNTQNFRTITEALLRERAAVVVANPNEMESFVRRCLVDAEYREALGAAARNLTLKNQGATERTLERLDALLSEQG